MGRVRDDVTLVQISEIHAEAMLRWVSDAFIATHLGITHEPSLTKTLEWIRRINRNSSAYARAIVFRGEHVGNVVLDDINDRTGLARLSIYLGDNRARGCGVAFTACSQFLTRVFRDLNIYKVHLTVHPSNYAAIRLYRDLGFQLEGVLREEFVFPHGGRADAWRMGLLASDFISE